MSSLKSQITDEMKVAMRAKDKVRLGTIRLMLAEIKRIEVDERIELDDDRVLAVLDKMVKQRKDSIAQYQAAERPELAEKEQQETEVIKTFLPQPLSDVEIDAIIDAAIAATDASGMQAMGQVMAIIKPQLQGRADMGAVSGKVKAKL
ncbi:MULTISPECIES: GatB/YqeY domain-containing protein [unclassified Marinobacterium]|uniref:GatB/YqeY domain-containing protein n=1 Tax=unclassified Marinobacterium TaxID=2644139 RepID=UPI00156A293F|nr:MULTISPECIES: GatB/YqeY domain-containing protein [unclassified Marinobacterium]NRP09349.1 Yqey-like protein [Marinobacterium sp. xm-g-48]NRP82120.1 Yqey-like protein [Marinobacterium sp. xm-d-509]NRQ01033.1 Yqey-like protein [Marinobacterium sp. xm-d-530]